MVRTTPLFVDIREHQKRIDLIRHLAGDRVQVVQLDTGDYVDGDVAVEWKGGDFYSSAMSGTMFQQVQELSDTYPHPLLVVARDFKSILNEFPNRNAGIGFTASLIARGTPPLFLGNDKDAMDVMIKAMEKLQDGVDRSTNTAIRPRATARPDATAEQIQMSVLCGFPNMSGTRAASILQHFGSLRKFFNASPDDIKEVKGISGMADRWVNVIEANTSYLTWEVEQ